VGWRSGLSNLVVGRVCTRGPRCLIVAGCGKLWDVIGIDRVLFTADYPFADMRAGRQFLEQMPIPPVDREKIAHLNAERLLGIE
jgi:predicted TIM-barrel fold metal-dependent hydrolase